MKESLKKIIEKIKYYLTKVSKGYFWIVDEKECDKEECCGSACKAKVEVAESEVTEKPVVTEKPEVLEYLVGDVHKLEVVKPQSVKPKRKYKKKD